MDQIHNRFTGEQVKVSLHSFIEGRIVRSEVEEILQINKTRFFALLKEYRRDPTSFSISYERESPTRLLTEVEAAVVGGLLREVGRSSIPAPVGG